MVSFRGQASCAKMTSPGGKQTALACHPTKQVYKALEHVLRDVIYFRDLCQDISFFKSGAWPAISHKPGNTKGGSFTVPLTSSLNCLDQPVLKIKTKIVCCQTADSKPVKQEVNGTMILPPLVFSATSLQACKGRVWNTSKKKTYYYNIDCRLF
jgi:hypothetical protein